MTKETLKAFTPVIRPPEQISLTENSRQVLKKRYLRRGPDGNPSETIEGMFHRVASAVAEPDAAHGYDVATTEASFYGLLTSLRFFPNSPTFTGAGTPLGQLAACFTAGMRVTTENGIKPIIDLRPGDRVLTHRGRYRPVTEVFQRAYQGELLRIKVDLIGTTLEVTPEHPILTPGGWVKAGELKVGDAVAIGIPVGERPAATFDLAQLVYADELEVQTETETIRVRRPSSYQNSGRQANWQRRFVELTPDLARLCGYYISEGTIGPDERYIRFTFGTAEEVYAADVIDLMERLFGVPVNRSTSNFGNWQNLNFYSRAMTAWFAQNFGRHSYGKSIPVWLQYATPEVQEAFLVGTMRGDGLYYEKLQVVQGRTAPKLFRSLRLTLSNPGLIQQIWQMCLRLGYDAAVRPVDTTYVTENARVTAQVSLPPLQSRHLVEAAFGKTLPEPDPRYIRNTVRREEGRVFFRIASIEADDFTGTVYNCEVDEDHSYVTEGVVVHNCFVLPISDDMGRESDGIFQTLRDAALIQQTGGGNGFSFSRLRPKGDSVASSAGVATGPVGFLRVYDSAFGEVAQGGTRRGANMAVLRVDHPDIEEFITCKAEEGQIANFNISAGITDAFMRAVEADSDFDLINPRDGKVWRTVKARDLFDLIVTYAHHNGEPGALFLDAANRTNPLPHLYTLDATNPCGEQFLGPYENCCLGSINLAQHITADGQVDWEKLRESVVVATRFLDNVVDANKYVPAVPQLREAALRARRIGLGLMGLGDLMYALGVRYGSEEGQEFAAQVMEFIRYHCMLTSIELAEERGPFPAIKGSIYDPENLLWRPPTPITSYTRDWGRPLLDWDRVVQGIVEHGIRNAAQTTIAPTGTIGTVTGCEGYGCEPVFALAYTRTVKDNEKDLKLTYTSPLFEKALIAAGLDEATRQRISEQVSVTGSCQDVAEVPEAIRRVFVVASDITAEEHVRMQAALQAFVDNSISKTINFPATATVEDVAQAYRLAWHLGCKGLTVYVTGSRQEVVLETKATAEAKGKGTEKRDGGAGEQSAEHSPTIEVSYPALKRRPRPAALRGLTYRKETPLGTAYVTVNVNGGDQPFEVFMNVGKAGSDVAAVSEALGRLISLVLRLPSPLDATERLKMVVDQLAGIGGGRSMGFGANRVRSLPDAVAQVLREHLNSHYGDDELATVLIPEVHAHVEQLPLPIADRPIGDLCPDCGQATFIPTEGCRKCYACGYSEC